MHKKINNYKCLNYSIIATFIINIYFNINDNLKNSSYESDSENNIIKDSTNEINNKENVIRKEQKIPTIDIEEKENENENIFSSINNEINLQEEKYKNIQEDIFNLVGEKDYSHLMNLYTQIKDKDNLYNEIENFIENKNYTILNINKLYYYNYK